NPFDVKDVFMQKENGLIYLRFSFHEPLTSFSGFRLNVYLDTDNVPYSGLNIAGIGTDYLLLVGDLGSGFTGYLLKWNPMLLDFEFVGLASYFNSDPSAAQITIGLNNALLSNPPKISIYANAFNSQDLVNTIDYLPGYNLGFLSAAFSDTEFVQITPLFYFATPDSLAKFRVTIDPQGIPPGVYRSGITVYKTGINAMESRFIPINLTVTTGLEDETAALPKRFTVAQNYPNPFNSATRIEYELPQSAEVVITLYNILGERVGELYRDRKPAGSHSYLFDAAELSSGVYFYKVEAGQHTAVRKLMLLK
ncbi:MAG: T9SS type A sorting domain-containing protein, partial [Calditrichia bacterium]